MEKNKITDRAIVRFDRNGDVMAEFKVYGSTVNYLKNPCGIDENPAFSYKISSDARGGAQKTRRICVKEALTGKVLPVKNGTLTMKLLPGEEYFLLF